MTTAESLQEYLWKEPFDPFHFRATNDRVYAVRHPENLVIVGRTAHVYVGFDPDAHTAERLKMIPLLHITEIGDGVPDAAAVAN